MQVGQQIIDLLLREHLTVGRHFVPPHLDDVSHALVIGGHPTHRKVLALEDVLHAGPLASARGVRGVAAVTIAVVNPPPSHLLRVESEFGIAFAALDITSAESPQENQATQRCESDLQSNNFSFQNNLCPVPLLNTPPQADVQ